MVESASDRYRRYRRLVEEEPLPAALVDLDAFERNVEFLVAKVAAAGKTVRVATKSVRSIGLLKRIAARGGDAVRGVMAYSPRETSFLVDEGLDDIVVGYPTARAADARVAAQQIRRGAKVSLVADAPKHLDVAAEAARAEGTTIPIVVDVDVGFRPFGARSHIGVRRSPLHGAEAVVEFVRSIESRPGLVFGGLLAYEAHIAGIADHSAAGAVMDAAMRTMKRFAREAVLDGRKEIVRALERAGHTVPLFNGGGTGSTPFSAGDSTLTEITVGSGFLDSHLFDGYDGVPLYPAAFFALQVTRIPANGLVTCQSGGFIASGAAGPDRLPRPFLPPGLTLLGLEGAGEVQTPLKVPEGLELALGAPVFFRHAKAGELAEHFDEYLLVRGDVVEARAKTYRGQGQTFY